MKTERIQEPEITLVTPVELSASGCPPADCPPNAACRPNTDCNPFNCAPALRPCGPDTLGCYPTGKAPVPPRPGPRPPCYPG